MSKFKRFGGGPFLSFRGGGGARTTLARPCSTQNLLKKLDFL